MRDRILAVIMATTDPCATEIRYHRTFWKEYVREVYETDTTFEDCDLPSAKCTVCRNSRDALQTCVNCNTGYCQWAITPFCVITDSVSYTKVDLLI